jgi:hypothetical protein
MKWSYLVFGEVLVFEIGLPYLLSYQGLNLTLSLEVGIGLFTTVILLGHGRLAKRILESRHAPSKEQVINL